MQDLRQIQQRLRPKSLDKEAVYWERKWAECYREKDELKIQYEVAQTTILMYQEALGVIK